MPGSGKSIIGNLLSKKYKKKFIDTDKMIEKNQKMSIKEIFNLHGEGYFRELEGNLITKLECNDNCIISTGGGMPIYFNNMNKLMKLGITIFIDVPLEILISRAQRFNDRPMLTKDKLNSMIRLYNERIDIYNRAHIIYKTEGKLPDKICDEIIMRIEDYERIK